MTATPRPWYLYAECFMGPKYEIVGPVKSSNGDFSKANAALIVRAVNSHDALLAACEAALTQLRIEAGWNKHAETNIPVVVGQLYAAIALATAREPAKAE